MHLRFSLDFEGDVVTTGVQFERRDPYYGDYGPYPYYYGPYHHYHGSFSLGLGYYCY